MAFPEKVVVATDASVEAALAARMAAGLSAATGSELHLLTVSQDEPEKVLSGASREVEEAEGKVTETYSCDAFAGRIDAEIVSTAEELAADLIIVGSRGLGALKRALLGSVSDSVVRHAHCSVLVARDYRDEPSLPETILVAVDGFEESREAADRAMDIASAVDAGLHLVYVTPTIPSSVYPGSVIVEGTETVSEHLREQAQAVLAREEERLGSQGGSVADVHLVMGKPDEKIIGTAEDLDAGLLVIGSRGLGGVRRALLGSVSASVVRHAHCPVLVSRT